MTEAELQTAILGTKKKPGLAPMFGWRSAHFRAAKTEQGWRTPVQGDGKGFPDLVLTKGTRLIFAELKSATGKLSLEQLLWKEALMRTGAETYTWRPSDLEFIAKVLRAA